MQGSKSRSLSKIRAQIINGVNISHILHVRVSNEPENKVYALTIRREIGKRLLNIPHLFPILHNGDTLNVSITWTMPNAGTMSAFYYGVNLPYIDEIIGAHSRIMLSSIYCAIRNLHPEFGSMWSISYLISKPLALLSAIPQVDIDYEIQAAVA